MNRVTALLVVALLAGCGGNAATTSSTDEPATPTATATPEPTRTPEPTAAGLAEACTAIEAFRGAADAIGALAIAAFDSYETGDYAGWEEAATEVNDQFEIILPALEAVPSDGPYRAWKTSTYEIMLRLSDAIIAYDAGVQDSSLTQMEVGNAALDDANEVIGPMNDFASEWEGQC